MKIFGIKITIAVAFFLGPIIIGIAIECGGKVKAFAGMSDGDITKGYEKCITCDKAQWKSFEEADLIPGPVVGSVSRHAGGDVETNLGLAGQVSDPSHIVGLQVAATAPAFSSNTMILRKAASRNLSWTERYEVLLGEKTNSKVLVYDYRYPSSVKSSGRTDFSTNSELLRNWTQKRSAYVNLSTRSNR